MFRFAIVGIGKTIFAKHCPLSVMLTISSIKRHYSTKISLTQTWNGMPAQSIPLPIHPNLTSFFPPKATLTNRGILSLADAWFVRFHTTTIGFISLMLSISQKFVRTCSRIISLIFAPTLPKILKYLPVQEEMVSFVSEMEQQKSKNILGSHRQTEDLLNES